MIDMPQQFPTQIPPKFCDMAEKNFERAREAFLGFIGAAQKATGSAEALPSGAKEAVTKAISFAESNVNAAFDLAQKLLHAKDCRKFSRCRANTPNPARGDPVAGEGTRRNAQSAFNRCDQEIIRRSRAWRHGATDHLSGGGLPRRGRASPAWQV